MDDAMTLEFRLGMDVVSSGEPQAGARSFAEGVGKHGRFPE